MPKSRTQFSPRPSTPRPALSTLEQHAEAIKRLEKRALSATLAIGRHLTEAKRICGHGNWASWLETSFGWTDRTAENFMRVYETFKSETVSDLNLPMGSLYLLAAPSTPPKVRDDVIERVKRGERLSHKEVKALVSSARESALVRDDSRKTTSDPKKASSPITGEILEKVAEKEIAQVAPEIVLGAKQLASIKKYGLILSDCESLSDITAWRDQGARCAADVADDCVLFHRVTAPLLPQALEAMGAWGFTYKTHFVLVKNEEGPGYWNRNQHEILLVGTKGNIPAPAAEMQLPSVILAPGDEHSEKLYELIEHYYPTSPKIEVNGRRARDGWDRWKPGGTIHRGVPRNDDVNALGMPNYLNPTSPPV
jgi:hypothetical protein